MTYEIRANVEASFYKRPGEIGLMFSRKEKYEREIAERVADMIGATHKFVNVKVDIIPHDNDRDYTEEDAEAHLNGAKRKTYAEDFFEKFPNAPYISVGILHDIKVPAVHFWDVYGIDAMRKYVANPLMVMGDSIAMQGVNNDLWLIEKPEDADA